MIINPVSGVPYQKDITQLPWHQMKMFVALEETLQNLGISFFCTHCQKMFGSGHDGISASVNETGDELRLTCNHQDRVCKIHTGLKF